MSSAEQLAFHAPPLPADFVDEWRRLEAAAGARPATLEAVHVVVVGGASWITVAVNGRQWFRASHGGPAKCAKDIWAERQRIKVANADRSGVSARAAAAGGRS